MFCTAVTQYPTETMSLSARNLWRTSAQTARDVGQGLMGLAFPTACLHCGGAIPNASMLLCFCCLRNADRADADDVRERIDDLPGMRSAIDGAFALWMFDKGGFLQRIHQALKYENRPRYGMWLGHALGHAFAQTLMYRPAPDMIAPIPLHRMRLCERGYNQSEYLVRGIAPALEKPVATDVMVRNKATRSQTTLSRNERLDNLNGAFAIPAPERIAGRRILLVDDILTTGATAGVAASALLEAGADAVDVAALGVTRM